MTMDQVERARGHMLAFADDRTVVDEQVRFVRGHRDLDTSEFCAGADTSNEDETKREAPHRGDSTPRGATSRVTPDTRAGNYRAGGDAVRIVEARDPLTSYLAVARGSEGLVKGRSIPARR